VRDRSWTEGSLDLGDGTPIRFVRGAYRARDDSQVSLQIEGVSFGDVDGDGAEEAILIVSSNLGGAGTMIEGYVFGLKDGAPVLRARIEGGDRGEGGLESAQVAGGEVVVRRFETGPTDAVCCPSRVLIERWRWSNGQLVKAAGAPRVVRRPKTHWRVKQVGVGSAAPAGPARR